MRSQRGSRFRGVSKNGHKWQVSKTYKINYALYLTLPIHQVMIVKGELRKYLGAISSEE